MRTVWHRPQWVPAALPINAAGDTRPGFVCVHPLENGSGPCGGNVFRIEDAIGNHCCMTEKERRTVAFTKLAPSKGTVIPESHRPSGSTNAKLHELPAYREHTHELVGVVLYLPRQMLVVVPFRLVASGGAGCLIVEGDKTYPRGGYDIDVSEWELQRAEKVALETNARGRNDYWSVRRCASGIYVRTLVEEPVVVEPDLECMKCGVWLTRPGHGINFTELPTGPECLETIQCSQRYNSNRGIHRAPVQP